MKTKNKLVVRSIAMKEEAKSMLCFDKKKDTSKVKNTLLQWILQNIWENQMFHRIATFIVWSIKWTSWKVLIVKVDEIYNILKSRSHCLLVERWRWNWMIKIFTGVCPRMSIHLLSTCFIKGGASSCKKYSSWEFDIAI